MTATATITPSATREVTLTRVFDAPRSLVFKLWTEPKHLAKWWGPKSFTNPVCEVDARPGGAIRIVMRAPNGVDYPMTGSFREIVAPERLVFTTVAEDASGGRLIEGLTTVTFAEHGGKTTVTVHARAVALVPIAEQMIKGMDAGWTQSLEKLADLVQATCQGAMKVEPQQEHAWLKQLVGEWTYESTLPAEPGQSSPIWKGSETVRSLGDLWVIADGQGEMPGGATGTTMMTLGYDPQRKQFVGTWIGSMMTHLWRYEDGALDAAGRVLTLNAEGPSMSGDGTMAKYQDVIELKSDDHRTLSARILRSDGTWHQFMTVHYRRKR